MCNWGRHPDILSVVREENARREEAAKVSQKKVEQEKSLQTKPHEDEKDSEWLKREAEAKYPEPDTIHTKTVADFVRLLRAAAPEDKLRKAAEEVRASPKGRDDVYRYGPAVTKAYDTYVEGVDLRQANRRRGDRGGLG